MKIRFLSISEFNNYISKAVKADPILQCVCVYGEVSNLKLSSGGYLFFSLKDSEARLDCVSFQPETLNLELKDGMEIEVVGSLSFYQKSGNLKLIVREAKRVGIGKAFEKYLELARVLEKEGLFLSSRKKKIKEIPEKLGVITSTSGAVLQDIRNVTAQRYPQCELIVYPARVQGEGTTQTIMAGIDYFNTIEPVDTIIVARGGGSYEDLIEFNDEDLARAVAKSKIPIISAIGHETDNTILDLVADLRASTPSMAAELALPSRKQLSSDLEAMINIINRNMAKKLEEKAKELANHKKFLDVNSPISVLERRELSLNQLRKELKVSIDSGIGSRLQQLDTLGRTLSLINPILPYERGFAIIKKADKLIVSAEDLLPEDEVDIKFKDGSVKAIISGG